MRKSEHVSIGDHDYTITQLPLRESRALLVRLTNLLGPALGDAVTGTDEGVTVDGNTIGGAIKTLATSISDADFDYVQNALFKCVTWRNDQGDNVPLATIADDHFAGDGLDRLFRVIFAALKVNYADFLGGLGLAGLIQVNRQPANRPTSTGSSGE